MKLITFLACIMMGLSIWSVTAHAQTVNPQPAGVNPPSADSFAKASDCPVCAKNMKENTGCQSAYGPSDCKTLYDGKKGEEKAVTPSGTVQ